MFRLSPVFNLPKSLFRQSMALSLMVSLLALMLGSALSAFANPASITLIGEGPAQSPYAAQALVRSWAQEGVALLASADAASSQSESLVIWWSPALSDADLNAVKQTLQTRQIPLALIMTQRQYQSAGTTSLQQWLEAVGWGDISGRAAAEAGQSQGTDNELKRYDSLNLSAAIKPLRVLILLDDSPVSAASAPLTLAESPDDQPLLPQVDSEVSSEVRSATFAKRLLDWLEQAKQLFMRQRMARQAVVRKYLNDLEASKSLFWEDAEVMERLEGLLFKPSVKKTRSGSALSQIALNQNTRLGSALKPLSQADKLHDQLVLQGEDPSIPETTLTEIYQQSKALYQQAWARVMPPLSPAHDRALWLDRGTIVKAGSPEGLRQLLAGYKALGIKDIFIETLNAGFPIYDSQVQPKKNPLIKGWDPLAVAVEAGHKNGQRIHAWVWCFAVGNRRHNPLIGERDEYVGPILEQSALSSEALKFSRAPQGALARQEEFWLTPASQSGQDYLVRLYEEIVTNYAVDGLHLDYIRWPFQKSNWLAGVDALSLRKFYTDITPPPPQYPGPSPLLTFQAEAVLRKAESHPATPGADSGSGLSLPSTSSGTGDFSDPIQLPDPAGTAPHVPSDSMTNPASPVESKLDSSKAVPSKVSMVKPKPLVKAKPAKPASGKRTGAKRIVRSTIKPSTRYAVKPKPKAPELTAEQKALMRTWERKKAIWEAYQARLKRQEEAINRGAIPDNRAQWQSWKAEQVSHFVQTLSQRLKAQRPNLIVSGAVFALPRANRMAMIQQDWERWLREGWVDWLTPMTYTDQVGELRQQVAYLYSQAEATGSLMMPGLGLHKLDGPTTVLAMRALQQSGVAGHNLFAASQLTEDKRAWLKQGPYQLASQVPGEPVSPELGRQWLRQQAALLKTLLGPAAPKPLGEVANANADWYATNWKPLCQETRQWIWDTYGYQPQWANYLTGELMRLNLLVRYVQRREGAVASSVSAAPAVP